MSVIDQQGRFLGVVNVIDAWAVLLVLALVLAAVALATSLSPPPTPMAQEGCYL